MKRLSFNKAAHTVIWLAAALLIVIGWAPLHSWAGSNKEDDLTTMVRLSSELLGGDSKLLVYQGAEWEDYDSQEEFQLLFNRLTAELGMEEGGGPSRVSTIQGRPEAERKVLLDGSEVTVRLVGLHDGRSTYVTVRWEGRLDGSEQAAAWRTNLNEVLQGLGIQLAWRTEIQGITEERASAEQMVDQVSRLWQAEEIDRYQDIRSLSVSLTSSVLDEFIWNGNSPMHLQAALHQVTETEQWRLTLGTPVILSEY